MYFSLYPFLSCIVRLIPFNTLFLLFNIILRRYFLSSDQVFDSAFCTYLNYLSGPPIKFSIILSSVIRSVSISYYYRVSLILVLFTKFLFSYSQIFSCCWRIYSSSHYRCSSSVIFRHIFYYFYHRSVYSSFFCINFILADIS